jgi:hypothetical protein
VPVFVIVQPHAAIDVAQAVVFDSCARPSDGEIIQVVETANIAALPNMINRDSFISSFT